MADSPNKTNPHKRAALLDDRYQIVSTLGEGRHAK